MFRIAAAAGALLAVAAAGQSCYVPQSAGTAPWSSPSQARPADVEHGGRAKVARPRPAPATTPRPAVDANGTGVIGSDGCDRGWVCGTCPAGTHNAGAQWGYDAQAPENAGFRPNCNA
jgi:hypothetical protein